MASGSQTKSGICALLPVAGKQHQQSVVIVTTLACGPDGRALAKTSAKFSVPKLVQMNMIASASPKSPMRLTMNAFLPASAADGFSNQKPISR